MRYVYLHPLFDERKCAHRFVYELRVAFAGQGLKLEDFDYRGTAEAQGEFAEVSLESLRKDVVDYLTSEQVYLIGVRFGATLAADYCIRHSKDVEKLILVEPILDGAKYVDYLRRKQRIKDVMTGLNVAQLGEKGFENLEGYKTSARFIEELKEFTLPALVQRQLVDSCICIATAAKDPHTNGDLGRFADVLKTHGNKVLVEHMAMPVFWERIGRADYSPVIQEVLGWCNG